MKIALVGAGIFGVRHLNGLVNIEGIEIASIADVELDRAKAMAAKYGAARAVSSLGEVLSQPEVDAVIVCTPTPYHVDQVLEVLRLGKHLQIESPVAESWVGAQRALAAQAAAGLVCMVSHTRRFTQGHIWIHNEIAAGRLAIQHLDAQTYFSRRTNVSITGEEREWTDHLLWHQAANVVDLFQYQTGEKIVVANAVEGPLHPTLGIAMDLSIQLQSETGKVCTVSLSFNNDLTLGTYFRYICDNGTYLPRHDDLFTGADEPIDVSGVAVGATSIEIQDREFITAIAEGREPNSSIAQVLECYRVLGELELQLQSRR